jgi:hypothetical protein
MDFLALPESFLTLQQKTFVYCRNGTEKSTHRSEGEVKLEAASVSASSPETSESKNSAADLESPASKAQPLKRKAVSRKRRDLRSESEDDLNDLEETDEEAEKIIRRKKIR